MLNAMKARKIAKRKEKMYLRKKTKERSKNAEKSKERDTEGHFDGYE